MLGPAAILICGVPEARFRILYDREGIHVLFLVHGRFVISRAENLGEVWRDSCVEFFLQLPGDPLNYFNIEVNRGGAVPAGYSRSTSADDAVNRRSFSRWTRPRCGSRGAETSTRSAPARPSIRTG